MWSETVFLNTFSYADGHKGITPSLLLVRGYAGTSRKREKKGGKKKKTHSFSSFSISDHFNSHFIVFFFIPVALQI